MHAGVRVFVTGSRRWIDPPGWRPPARDTAWYLHPAGWLDCHPPSAGTPKWFRYDPADPTPSVGLSAGQRTTATSKLDRMLLASPVSPCRRPGGDRAAAGPACTCRGSVAHIDLACPPVRRHPAGPVDQHPRRDRACHPFRSRHPTSGQFDLWPVAQACLRGHRIRLQVSGGAHPRYGRNLGTAEPVATGTRLQASVPRCLTSICRMAPRHGRPPVSRL